MPPPPSQLCRYHDQHRGDIWIQWPQTLQSHMILATNITDSWMPAPMQGYVTTTTTKVIDLCKYHIYHCRAIWIPWPIFQNYVNTMMMSPVIWKLWTVVQVTQIQPLLLQSCVNVTPLWQGYVSTTATVSKIYEEHSPLCSYEIPTPYVNITTTSQSYVNTIISHITKWSHYYDQSDRVVSQQCHYL